MMRIALLGDMAFFGKFDFSKYKERLFDYFREMREYLSSFDYVVGNLEVPLTTSSRRAGAKSAYIAGDPACGELLRWLGIDAVNIANNHIFDFGFSGYRSTIEVLERYGIRSFGCEDKDLLVDEARVVFHGYCSYNTNPLGLAARGGVVDELDVRLLLEKFKAYQDAGYLNIISVHSGFEHVNYPSIDDITLARKLSTIAPYVYYGHHPHVVQGSEVANGAVIAYSLGNFCFDDVYTEKSRDVPLIKQNDNNKRCAILELDIVDGRASDYSFRHYYLGGSQIVFDEPVAEESFLRYCKALKLPSDEYQSMRSEHIQKYLDERKSLRDIQWYLARMNMNSVRLLLSARRNKWAYRRAVSQVLAELE